MEPLVNRNYEILTLPVDYKGSFLDLDIEEIKQYYEWFLNIKDERKNIICNFLFENPSGCLSEKNLKVIELFLVNSTNANPLSENEIALKKSKIASHLRPYVEFDKYLLDKKTVSICYDIGIYLGDLIISLDSKVKWKLETDIKDIDYGQPVLTKNGCKLTINPFIVAKNTASKIYKKTYHEGQIISFFNAWKKGFKVGNEPSL
ncbi:MAG: hypothetical protein H6605_10825 [Flavobacteriales bacterium]|nr:hypothetical protein [Flavobacteriales bacterium]